jgi:hypothetical protein
MKPEYDFQNGVRGKFFRPDASARVPVYLDLSVLEFFSAKAEQKGVEVDEIINELLKRDIAIIETAG